MPTANTGIQHPRGGYSRCTGAEPSSDSALRPVRI